MLISIFFLRVVYFATYAYSYRICWNFLLFLATIKNSNRQIYAYVANVSILSLSSINSNCALLYYTCKNV